MEKVLVTGGDGFLGNNIVRELLARGYIVRVFAHPSRNLTILDDLDVEVFSGDILEEEEVIKAAEGCDFIIHAAANTSIWPTRSEIIRTVNYKGTQHVLSATKLPHIKRLVAISSATAFENGTLENPGTEKNPFTASRFGLDYIDSKKLAQDEVVREVKDGNLDAVILNPTFMLGPYDSKPSSGELLLSLYYGKIPGYTKGGRNFVHVHDVAVAAANALNMGKSGECYLLANENMPYKDFYSLVSDIAGVKTPNIKIPGSIILTIGWLSERWARLWNKTPKISYAVAQISLLTNYYSSIKAVEELNLPQTPVKQAVQDAFDWFRENGYLEKR